MSQVLIISALLLVTSYAKPISSCNSQMQCMDLDITLQSDLDDNGKEQYEICFYWRQDLPECTKKDKISHACPSSDKKDKIENWNAGRANAMCNIVSCGGETYFGVKDGRSCDGGSAFGDFGITGYNEWVTCYDGGYCGGGNTKACRWLVSAPQCDDDPDTTASPTDPATTASATTQAPDTTCAVCNSVNDDAETFANLVEVCFATDGCALATEDGCECHECDCAAINDAPGYDKEAECTACGNCAYDSEESACIATVPVDSPDNLYVRDRDTLENTNLLFESHGYNNTDHEATDGAGSMNGFVLGLYVMITGCVMYMV
eukprot:204338_1